MQSIENQIKRVIISKPRGVLFFPNDFNQFGSSAAIRKALQRLKERGVIRAVAHGIYVRPKSNDYIGELMPTTEEIIHAIAKRDKIRLMPSGAYAQHALGLTTQIPLNPVFLTDGAPRTIKVGKSTIKLKKTTPKNLMTRGPISSLVIQALREVGKYQITPEVKRKVFQAVRKEEYNNLQHDMNLAPEWIRSIMKAGLE